LTVYVHDHRAGTAAAVELLNHLEQAHSDTAVAPFAAALRIDVEADVRELEGLMSRLGIVRSIARSAGARLSAKIAN
jgi:hypothetical protein